MMQSAFTTRRARRLLAFLAMAAAGLLGPWAQAAEIEEIVVTARAVEESIRDIPVAITAVNEERMNQFAIESLMDLEALTPQLSIGRSTSGSGKVCPGTPRRTMQFPGHCFECGRIHNQRDWFWKISIL